LIFNNGTDQTKMLVNNRMKSVMHIETELLRFISLMDYLEI